MVDFMVTYDYLIIGNGIAGVTAADTIRENDPISTIGIIGDEPYVLYSRTLLPAYLKKRVSRSRLFLREPEDFDKKKIDLLLKEKVSFVDVKKQEVGLINHKLIGYHKLLIASGGRVRRWRGVDDEDFIYRLHTLDDADRLLREMDDVKKPLVVGSSFISLEFLDIFTVNNIVPLLLVKEDRFFPKFLDKEGGELLRDNFEMRGIQTQFDDTVSEIAVLGENLEVETKGLRKIKCDSVALGIGIDRNTEFLHGSDIKFGAEGIRTDEFLETSRPGIFVAGDAAEYYDLIFDEYRGAGNWNNAFLQGRTAGLNMVGKRAPFKNVSSYSIANLGFQITILGYCKEGMDTIVRIDYEAKQYERFFVRSGVLTGTVMINRFQDKPHLAQLIKNKVSVEKYKYNLDSFGFDIRSIEV